MGSSSGPTSTSTTTNPYEGDWRTLINNVSGLTQGGYGTLPTYGGPTVAPLSGNQLTAADMARIFATQGSPAGNAGNAAIANIAATGGANPLAGTTNPYVGATNPLAGTANPYIGANPFMQQVIDPSNKAITDAYRRGVAAQTDAAAARAGAYGGSGYQEQVGVNQRNLADALAANTGNLMAQNYYQNAANWQTDAARNAGLYGQDIGRSAELFAQDAARNAALYGQGTQNQLAAAGLAQGSQAADLAAINALMGTGAMQQGQTQSVLDAMKGYFGDTITAQFAPAQILASILGQAQGNTTTTLQGPGTNNWLSGLSLAGLLGSNLIR